MENVPAIPQAPAERWSAATLSPDRQFEGWRQRIVDAHLNWDIPLIRCDRFPAWLRQQRVDGVRLTACTTAAEVRGKRQRAQIVRDDEAFLTVVLIAEGTETLTFGDRHGVCLRRGMFTLWDSSQPMTFATSGDLMQISLLVPAARMLQCMPRVRDLVGVPMGNARGASALFADHLCNLADHCAALPGACRQGVIDATLELLAACLSDQPALVGPQVRHAMLQAMKRHIARHLNDPGLGVASLARAFRMSERSVHKVFQGSQTTVSQYIRDRRLDHCRRDLESSTLAARHVGEIAKHWGFDDPSHFSKVFRSAYGISASELRAQLRASK